MAFFVIGQFWLAHGRAFGSITGHREGLASLTSHATVSYGRRMGLIAAGADPPTLRDTRRRMIITGGIPVSIALAWVSTGLAEISWLLMIIAPRIAARWTADGPAPDDAL